MENSTAFDQILVQDESDFFRYLRKIDGFLKLTVGLLAVVGNTMVFIAYAISRRLQTKTNILVVNLAMADFLTGLVMPIFAWSLYVDIEYIEPWMEIMCGIAMALGQAFVGCSLITLAFIAFNRLVLITRRKETYQRIFRGRNIAIYIAISWTVPFIVDTIPLFFGIGELGFDEVAHICGAKTNHPYAYHYDILIVTLLIPIPMLVIIYSYARIFLFIRRHNQQLMASSSKGTKPQTVSSVSGKYVAEPSSSSRVKRERMKLRKQADISKNLFYVVVVFVICLSPHLLAVLFRAGPYVLNQTKIMGVSNGFMNPILYGVKHPHFRMVFACILSCRWKDVPQPSKILKSILGRSHRNKNFTTSEAGRSGTPTVGHSTSSV